MYLKCLLFGIFAISASSGVMASEFESHYDTDYEFVAELDGQGGTDLELVGDIDLASSNWRCVASNGRVKFARVAPSKLRAKKRSLAVCKANTPRAPQSCYVKSCKWIGSPSNPPPNREEPWPRSCQFNMDCGLWQVCAGGRCVDESGDRNQCQWSGDCDGAYDCVGGRCVPKTP